MRIAIERFFARMPVRCVSQVVPERDRLGQILVKPQRPRYGARDLAYFERVCQPRAIVIALRRQKHLRLVLKATKRFAVQDPVAVALKIGTQPVRQKRLFAPFALRGVRRILTQVFGFDLVRYVRITRSMLVDTLLLLRNRSIRPAVPETGEKCAKTEYHVKDGAVSHRP